MFNNTILVFPRNVLSEVALTTATSFSNISGQTLQIMKADHETLSVVLIQLKGVKITTKDYMMTNKHQQLGPLGW